MKEDESGAADGTRLSNPSAIRNNNVTSVPVSQPTTLVMMNRDDEGILEEKLRLGSRLSSGGGGAAGGGAVGGSERERSRQPQRREEENANSAFLQEKMRINNRISRSSSHNPAASSLRSQSDSVNDESIMGEKRRIVNRISDNDSTTNETTTTATSVLGQKARISNRLDGGPPFAAPASQPGAIRAGGNRREEEDDAHATLVGQKARRNTRLYDNHDHGSGSDANDTTTARTNTTNTTTTTTIIVEQKSRLVNRLSYGTEDVPRTETSHGAGPTFNGTESVPSNSLIGQKARILNRIAEATTTATEAGTAIPPNAEEETADVGHILDYKSNILSRLQVPELETAEVTPLMNVQLQQQTTDSSRVQQQQQQNDEQEGMPSNHEIPLEDDEIMDDPPSKGDKKDKGRPYMATAVIVAVVVVVILIIVVVVIVVLLTGDQGDDSSRLPRPEDDDDNHDDDKGPLSREDQLLQLFLPLSGISALTNSNVSSAHYQAFQWILNEDPMQLQVSANNNNNNNVYIVERFVLVLLYFATNDAGGSSWTNKLDFLSAKHVCDWYNPTLQKGIIECHENRRVRAIALFDNNLWGTLPAELGALNELYSIALFNNHIHGPIPQSLENSTKLEIIRLEQNNLSGTIPDLSKLSLLDTVSVFENQLTGSLPGWLTTMNYLRVLSAEHNFLTGSLPEISPRLTLMEWLLLSNNLFEGSIPTSIGSLLNVELIALDYNKLSGAIPTSMDRLRNLKYIYLNNNQFTGSIPTNLIPMRSLELITVSRNQLSGPIPTEVGSLQRLKYLYLDANQLTGSVPSELAQLENLIHMSLQNNSIVSNLTDLCSAMPRLDAVGSLETDCVGSPAPQVVCPCCTTCCNDVTGECQEMQTLQARCMEKAVYLEDLAVAADDQEEEKKLHCTCSEESNLVSCMDTDCRRCNRDESVCYNETNPGISLSIVDSSFSVSVQYVRGRDEMVSFHHNGTNNACAGYINGHECASCFQTTGCAGDVLAAQYRGGQLDCSNLGYGVHNPCDKDEANNPFFALWDTIDQLYAFDGILPVRAKCANR